MADEVVSHAFSHGYCADDVPAGLTIPPWSWDGPRR